VVLSVVLVGVMESVGLVWISGTYLYRVPR
jgi:hypothetical protein